VLVVDLIRGTQASRSRSCMADSTLNLVLADRDEAVMLFGHRDQFLRMIRDALQVRLVARGDAIQIEGPPDRIAEAERVFQQLRQAKVKRLALVRPAVEAGERLGFLPGDMAAKVNPYLRPLFDALNDMMEPEQVKRYMENDIIEIVPLAYMRGRTLNQAVIILDEGQNTTVSQMKMFLTRMGHGSKIIVTGDITQVDLPRESRSGLIDAVHRLKNIERIAIVYLDENDIV